MRVAVTGGAGYIGSHTVVELLEEGHEVLILDSFANAAPDVPDRITAIARHAPRIVRVDITDAPALTSALQEFAPEAVLHFAGLKAVGEAVSNPLEYYRVNVTGSLVLLQAMQAAKCRRLVFSSSATVYGDPDQVPIPEDHPLRPTNPYGHSKRMIEQVIEDWGVANPEIAAVNLRYFNPVGAHASAQIGEAPSGTPNNLMPYVAQVAAGQRPRLSVFGDDYDTPDGTGVRDYIHVVDLAQAHLAALGLTATAPGVQAINVGTGRGYSVLEMVRAFEGASGKPVPFDIVARRPGDVATSLANPGRAADRLNWTASRDLDAMCEDAWRWQSYLLRKNS
ncbi:UDP-glucose 4-epimerase GalE [uncultured Roseobacter sp.]|uniref:UDP-glucose 4-epimerase GalE n=1 Tax=uncultured Roseobacter sp. TaxID=114847 RepID=UPI0026335C6D|nr:UDP-glucose 4-epimerase GalE [uncultured Roseobacter sp.]